MGKEIKDIEISTLITESVGSTSYLEIIESMKSMINSIDFLDESYENDCDFGRNIRILLKERRK